jgi:tRNA pseudouridine38-40 synthase
VPLKLTLAYDGTRFRGWAQQPGERTIEDVLARALANLYSSTGRLSVAGRTDAGVHALANIVSVEVEGGPPPGRAAEALNAGLPSDLSVIRAEEAPDGFDARFSAKARMYRYRIWCSRTRWPFETSRSLWHPRPLDLERLNASAELLVGEHDFRAFTPTETQHGSFVRVIEAARWYDRGETIELEITADSFLRHMVRVLVGTMLELEPDELVALLEGAQRSEAGTTVAACGLYFVGVRYG